MPEVWFWHQILSPHMLGLANALARSGIRVTYVAGEMLSAEREAIGWSKPAEFHFRFYLVRSRSDIRNLVCQAPKNSIHICEGLRANGTVAAVQNELARRGAQQWIVIETIDATGLFGVIKKLVYFAWFKIKGHHVDRVLAIGHLLPEWITKVGFPREKIFPFAYFLVDNDSNGRPPRRREGPFRFIFVGQLIRRKQVEVLIQQLGALDVYEFELIIVGNGPERLKLVTLAQSEIPGRVQWLGVLARNEALTTIGSADCLVLPSQHDGWGAVISEALMAGTPVICSCQCGAANIVSMSGFGGVFQSSKPNELGLLLARQIEQGPITPENRLHIAKWAKALGANAGADYLLEIVKYSPSSGKNRPRPPWDR